MNLTMEIIRTWLKILNEKYLAFANVNDQKKTEEKIK